MRNLWASIFHPPQPLKKHICFLCFLFILMLVGLLPEYMLERGELRTYENASYTWFSAHFIHLNFQHTLMNVAGALVIWLLCVFVVPTILLVILMIVLPVAISLGLIFLSDVHLHYRGFSGMLEGFFIVGVIWQWWLSRTFSVILACFIMGKIITEQLPSFDDTYLMNYIGGLVAVDAHLYGLMCGITCAFIYLVLAIVKVPFCVAPWQMTYSVNQ